MEKTWKGVGAKETFSAKMKKKLTKKHGLFE